MRFSNDVAAVTGRFQPVHDQHLDLFRIALDQHDSLIIGVTNPDSEARREEGTSVHRHTDDANPFTYYQRITLLAAALDEAKLLSRTTIVPFDLTRPHLWHEYVPYHSVQYVRSYSEWEQHKASALRGGGYRVVVIDGNPEAKMDASAIRGRFHDGTWSRMVPPSTVPLVRAFLGRI